MGYIIDFMVVFMKHQNTVFCIFKETSASTIKDGPKTTSSLKCSWLSFSKMEKNKFQKFIFIPSTKWALNFSDKYISFNPKKEKGNLKKNLYHKNRDLLWNHPRFYLKTKSFNFLEFCPLKLQKPLITISNHSSSIKQEQGKG